jgi:T5SS/PEP-CTERM-associated repeat protein
MLTVSVAASARAQQLGNITVSGPVYIDGLPVTGTGSIPHSARISTGAGGSATLTLTSGGQVLVREQSDVIVSLAGTGVKVQLICGEVDVTSTATATVVSVSGGVASVNEGTADVTIAGDPEPVSLKKGKQKSSDNSITAVFSGSSGVLMKSRIQCVCNC